jgi:PAS domain S-box-containing protein
MRRGLLAKEKTKNELSKELVKANQHLVGLEKAEVKSRQLVPEVRRIKERLEPLFECVPEVFWLHDTEADQMVYVSPAYEKIWGRSVPDLYQNFSDWFDGIHDDDRQRVCRAFISKAAEGYYNETYRVVRPDGEVRWIHDCAYPVRDGTGEVLRIVGIAQDVTQLNQTQLRRLKAENSAVVTKILKGIADLGLFV